MSVNERVAEVIKTQFGGNKRAFAQQIGVSATVVENIVGKRQGKPSFDVAVAICANANISAEWLLTGEGEMLRTDKPQPCAAPPPEPTAATADTIPLVDIIRRQAEEIGYLKARLAQMEARNGAE